MKKKIGNDFTRLVYTKHERLLGRGRLLETWRRCMEREMKDVGITWVALSKKAQDRDVWRMFVCGLYTDRGERQ